MQPKFTRRNLWSFCAKMIAFVVVFAAYTQLASSQDLPKRQDVKGQHQNMLKQKAQVESQMAAAAKLTNDAGVPAQKIVIKDPNSPQAVCTTFTGTVDASDPSTSLRGFRDGVPKTCAAPGTCTAGLSGSFQYEQRVWVNPIASPQCVTVTYTNTATNFSFVTAHNGSVNLANLCTNWLGDPGSSAAAGASITWSFVAPASATIVFMVTNLGSTASYSLTIDAAVCSGAPCSGTPSPGNTLASVASACPAVPVALSLQNTTPGSGVTYQWQTGTSSSGPWTNAGPNASTWNVNQTSATWYRCIVTCSGNSGTSNPVFVAQSPFTDCYCISRATSNADEDIFNVSVGSLNNSSNCTTTAPGPGSINRMYSNYTTLPPANLVIGSLPVSVQIGTCGGNYTHSAAIWIDLNQNGSFENPAERVFLSGTGAGPFTHSGNLVIPSTATLGITGMRVVNVETGTPANITPCGTYTWGETEDYLVNIQPCVPVTAVTNPTTFTTQCSGNVSLTASAGSASFPSWAWEMRVNASSPWQNAVAGGLGGVIVSANTNVLQLAGVPSSLNGYQFRPVVVNPCTAIDFGQTATLSVTPLVATVTPTSSTICAGSIIPLTLTNTTSPTTVSFPASAGLPLNIPDNNPTGVLSNLTVAGIPAGAAITEVRMTFNMTHTWVGDMVLNLRAPNGQVINLIGLLDGGSGSNGTANFTNTTVSSDNTRPAMSGAPAPRNGIFRADRYSATVPSLLPTTTSLWGNLVPNGAAANGTWTLGLCDLGPADVGVLQSWTITITYGAPAAGIWSATPAAPNTMWLNAAGTIPYDGSAQNTIYVNPAVNSTYCVVYSTATPACTSGPTCIPVNVVNPIGGSSTVANRTVCVGGTTSFSTSPTGGPFTFQWQESRDNGLTWNNVSNNALYGGATTSTLTLTGVTRSAPLDMNNFLYRCNINTAPCGGVVTTNAGLLTVNALPAVTISATDLALLPNQTTTITASSNPAAGGAPNWAWTRNGAPIANSTGSQSVNIDQLGVYQVSVTDVNGCRNSSNQLLIEAENSDKLWLYPNPTSGAFQVRLWYSGVTTEKRRIQVFNSAGAEVMSRDIDLSSVTSPRYQRIDIDLGFMPGGVYLVRVIDLYSKKSKSGFVIKQTK